MSLPLAGAVVLAGGRGTRMAGDATGAAGAATRGAGAAGRNGAAGNPIGASGAHPDRTTAAPGASTDAPALSDAQLRAAATGLKGLVPVAGRPFIEHALEALAEAGVAEACVVVGPHGAALQEHLVGWGAAPLRLAFAEQAAPRGTADAVLAAEGWADGRPFLVVNADNLYAPAAVRPLLTAHGHALAGFDADALVRLGNIPAERVAAFALVRADAEGRLLEIVEKPDAEARRRMGSGARVSMTCWRFEASVFAACRRVAPSPRGELELPDAVRLLVAAGDDVRVHPVAAGVLDLTGPGDVPAVERLLAEGWTGD